MSEIINIEIQADQSGAEEALQQVNNSLKEGKEAAEALSHVLDGDLATLSSPWANWARRWESH